MPCYVSVAFVCPRLFSITDIPEQACIPDSENHVYLPSALKLSSESIETQGLYLLDDGRFMYMYIGQHLPESLLNDIFEIQTDSKDQKGSYGIRQGGPATHISTRVQVLVNTLRKSKPFYQNLQYISKRNASSIANISNSGSVPTLPGNGLENNGQVESLDESIFFTHLIEDAVNKPVHPTRANIAEKQGATKPPNTMSYIDFLCWIHKRIQNKFCKYK